MTIDFSLSAKECRRIKAWNTRHKKKRCIAVRKPDAAGGRVSYILTPTGLGMCVVVRCACGAEADVTDVEAW